ncbi:MAG: nickel pincer cofactor biosynthesis protein LarC [Deltaproteobacteria bacterium]|nr:nickel pincer cofactor biosynthesis protein LarC [Deltaproteobacteria bacterium]
MPHGDHGHDHDHGHAHAVEPALGALGHGAGVGKLLHLDCFSGVAGDMLVAALLDLGVPRGALTAALEALPIDGYEIGTEAREEHGIAALRFVVKVTTPQPSRTWRGLRAMLEAAPLQEEVRRRALATFSVLARAEGRVHRMPPEDVHFHEVGAVDAVVDIVCASAALAWLGARVTCAPLPLGRGFVRAAHGVLPLPAPAVLEVLQGVPTVHAAVDKELVTPTGAAIVKAQASEFLPWPSLKPLATGFGAGSRSLPDRPNLLRVVLGDPVEAEGPRPDGGTHLVLETNLDDVTGQVTAHVAERLLREGALDTWVTPVTMKKGRPGVTVSALARASEGDRLARVLLAESPALGVRLRWVERRERPRRMVEVSTPFGPIPVKVADGDGLPAQAQPEFEVCRAAAESAGVPLREVQAAALASWWSRRGGA